MRLAQVLSLLLTTLTLISCNPSSSKKPSRAEIAEKLEFEFHKATATPAGSGERPSELRVNHNPAGFSFFLTTTREKDLETLAPILGKLFKQYEIKSAGLTLAVRELVIDGEAYGFGKTPVILGGYRIHSDGSFEASEDDSLPSKSR